VSELNVSWYMVFKRLGPRAVDLRALSFPSKSLRTHGLRALALKGQFSVKALGF
jgi:hypothetical protein